MRVGQVRDNEVVIAGSWRTATGKFRGALSNMTMVEMTTDLARRGLGRAHMGPAVFDQVILGNVLSTGTGQNVARQVQVGAGMPIAGTAMTVNQVCGSGLKAVRLAQTAVAMGDAQVVLAGGGESMSNAPAFASRTDKNEFDIDHWIDTLHYDALNDAFDGRPMGVTAENLARRFGITRDELDRYAVDSQRKASAAWEAGWFDDEVLPVGGLERDETMRPGTTFDGLSVLKPAYEDGGVVTAGNASPLSDGAAVMVVTTMRRARELGFGAQAVIRGYAEVGHRPDQMGYATIPAIERVLERCGQTGDEIDLYEVNEAFAAQAWLTREQLGINPDRYNVSGGALALGHALGASGARILTTLIHSLQRTGGRFGVAALCVGGGQGVAMEVESVR
ncbi:acetyl-CoA C-acetyltransferase [Bifidobacterium bohemicum]|uniref:Probable acetyl-CoA acetyltransferase n=1 Tax=Bifidobacterium bohemicum DSM 22767 TaxID=1437606 RepID=A0A086ZGY1_9BIFI|nr:thiolase family protein [Bifidobacterium bohemicum]KFI45781.1 acetyl-CoA acetyltransferase [Bifidobacterium bohemicum DSM 22767]SCC11224.1 acetyl-CoA C-acetyltransferase [Bifidobacterium bohemicum]